jgi:serine/threonine-protein kinase
MTPRSPDPRRQEIEAVFDQAVELARPDREAWLHARCAADPSLLREVSALLAAHDRAEGVLERTTAAAATAVGALRELNRGRRIGAYRVLRELGRGGMGIVYLAERADGHYHQRVALKLLRGNADTDELRRLFLAERQILASLAHPGIARLLDGGVTEEQLPYLVMEYVDGVPLTTWCDERGLDVEARLRLFCQVCQAIHYAHQNLVIHRDIKPANILVSAEGGVKLLDFGIAKLLRPSRGPGDPALTRDDFRPMTPEYASPEQVCDKPLTTASDVYALGIVLYELLSGRRPYRIETGSPQELTELVCAREPPRPSAVAADELRHVLRGDLDAIVMRALRKEAGDRYTSADLLAQDVQRYLDGQPVLAHRGTRLYRARKFLRRHRGQSAAAALVVLSLATGAGITARQATVTARERDRARRALADAEQALGQSESVTGFLVGLFDATAPTPGGPVTADDVLRRGAALVETLEGQPLMQARMLEAMGRVHLKMGRYAEARAALERSLGLRVLRLGPKHVEVAGSLYYLAEVLRRTGEYRKADSVLRRALAIRTAALGPRHPLTADVLAQLSGLAIYLSDFAGAERMSREALEIRRASLHPGDPLIGASLELHAAHLRRIGRLDAAEADLREAIALDQATGGPDSPDAAYRQLRLADLVLEARGDTAQADSLMRTGLATTRAALGENHPRTAWALGDLAALRSKEGRHAEAISDARTALGIAERVFGPRSVGVGGFFEGLSQIYRRAGRFADAERMTRRQLAIVAATVGTAHPAYASALGVSAELLVELGRYDEAIAERRRVMEIRRAAFGDGGALEGIDLAKLAQVHARKGEYATADSLFGQALANQRRYVPDTHPDVREIYRLISERYRLEGRQPDAERYALLSRPRQPAP